MIWTLSDRVFRLFVSFATGIMVVRLLAPEQFGVLSVANSLVGVLGFLNLAAVEGIVVRSLVEEPDARYQILGSALILRLTGSAMMVVTVLLISPFLNDESGLMVMVAVVMSGATLFGALEVGEYWLRKIMHSKRGVLARHFALSVGAIGRVWAAGSSSPLVMLAVVVLLESMLVAAALSFALYKSNVAPLRWQIDKRRIERISKEALPLLISAAAVGLYARIGVLLVGQFHGGREAGMLSVAITLAEAVCAIPLGIMASVTPALLERRTVSLVDFNCGFRFWLRRITWLGLAICLVASLIGPFFISALFDGKYDGATPLFCWLIWASFFVFMSAVSEVWILGSELQFYQLPKAFIAALCSSVLNLILVPYMGAKGAAISVLVSYSIAAVFGNLLFKDTRPLFVMQVESLLLFRHGY